MGHPPSTLTEHTASHTPSPTEPPAQAPSPLTPPPPTPEHRCPSQGPLTASQPGHPRTPSHGAPPQHRPKPLLRPLALSPRHPSTQRLRYAHQDPPLASGAPPPPRTDLPALPSWAPLGQRLRGRPGRKCHRAASPAHRRLRTPQHRPRRLVAAPAACRDM